MLGGDLAVAAEDPEGRLGVDVAPLGDDGVPKMLLEYREIAKVISGFIQPLLRQTDPVTGSVHTT
ncbi:MAG: hypothetical protein WBJ42_06335, partial [Thermovirgaceae bacterium]